MLEDKNLAHTRPSPAAVPDAVFKTLVESGLLLGLAAAHFAVGFSAAAALGVMILLLILSLAADKHLFGSLARAMAARRALRFKLSPLLVAGALVFLLFPADEPGDKVVRLALAFGIAGVGTALINLGQGRPIDA